MKKHRLIHSLAALGLVLGGESISWGQFPEEILQTQAESAVQPSASDAGTGAQAMTTAPSTPANSPFSSGLSSSSRSFSSGLTRPSSRLYDAPNMFGDLFSPAGTLTFQSNTQVLFLNPAGQATLDPAVLAAVQQQISQDATRQAQQQVIVLQNNNPSGSIDPGEISINVVLPDLSNALIQNSPQAQVITVQGMVDLQLAGGTRRTKIIENNHTLPMDRVSLLYNHFHNAIATDEFRLPSTDVNGVTSNLDVISRRNIQSLNRYTLGFEKTFEEGQSSVEFRLPLIGDLENSRGFDVSSQGGNLGNFSVILKRLFYTTDNFAVCAGLGINLPTGSDASGFVGNLDWEVTNEAVHYLPYLGVAGTPAEDFFYQAFVQLDIAGSGNPVDISNGAINQRVGRVNDQTLLFLDATGGAWLYRNSESRVAGIASILELHYTTTVQDADQFGILDPSTSSLLFFGQAFNRVDILNGSVGLHTVLQNGTSIRVGGVFPLSGQDEKRLFDAEVQASINVPF